jgi:hypothetical protein
MEMKLYVAVFVGLLAINLTPLSSAQEQDPLSVLFTGRLFGYLRIDTDTVPENRDYCLTLSGDNSSTTPALLAPETKKFFAELQQKVSVQEIGQLRVTTGAPGRPLLVGLGDNFGPRLEARAAQYGAFWRWRDKNPSLEKLQRDPVGCFLRTAGYNAIVPGKEDFSLGPERLRELANYMRCPSGQHCSEESPEHTVRVLGANISVGTTYKKTRAQLSDELKPLQFKTKHSLIQPVSAAPFLPVLQYLVFNASRGSSTHGSSPPIPYLESGQSQPVYLCGGYSDPDSPSVSGFLNSRYCHPIPGEVRKSSLNPSLQMGYQSDWVPLTALTRPSSQSAQPMSTFNSAPAQPNATIRWRLCGSPVPEGGCLNPNQNYLLCFTAPDPDNPDPRPFCQRVPVNQPFFDDSYQLLRRGGGVNDVVIFGIVDSHLNDDLSDSAGSWLERKQKMSSPVPSTEEFCDQNSSECGDPGRKIRVETWDAAVALSQAMDYFEMRYCRNVPDCKFTGKRVLLAQIDVSEAAELATHLETTYRFDLVFAKADRNHTTPTSESIETAVRYKSSTGGDQTTPYSTPVLVPLPISDDKSEKLYRVISSVSLTQGLDQRQLFTVSPSRECSADCLLNEAIVDVTKQNQMQLAAASAHYLCSILPVKAQKADYCNVDDTVLDHYSTPQQLDAALEILRRRTSSNTGLLTEAILQIMREKVNADVSMLETRELFNLLSSDDARSPDSFPLQTILDRILWEGSTLQRVNVTGATLKAILKRSQDYAQAQRSAISHVHTAGLALIYAGIRPGLGKDEYLINGLPLDDAKPYSIAIAERPVTTTADYPELRKQVDGEITEVDSSSGMRYISHVVCEELDRYVNPRFRKNAPLCDLRPGPVFANAGDSPGTRYFAHCPAAPQADPGNFRFGTWSGMAFNVCDTAMLSANSHSIGALKDWPYYLWAWSRGLSKPGTQSASSLPDHAEETVQLQPSGELTISEMSLAFSDFSPSLSPSVLNKLFPAPEFSSVNQSKTTSWAVVNTLRYRFTRLPAARSADVYMSTDVSYASQSVEKTSGPVISRQHNDWVAVPFGLEWNIRHAFRSTKRDDDGPTTPWDRMPPRLFFVFEPTRLRGQIKPTDDYFAIQFVPPPGSSCAGKLVGGNCEFTQHFRQDQSFAWAPRLGGRIENKASYIEIGYQSAYNWRLPRAFLFNQPNTSNFFACPDPNALQQCLNDNGSKLSPATNATELYTHHWQKGWYLDSLLRVPLPFTKTGFTYNFKNKGEFFNKGTADSATLTRYDLTMTNSLSVPLFWNLSLDPTVELFWYENQINYDTLFRKSYSVKLNYTLDDRFRRISAKQTRSYSPFSVPPSGAKPSKQ